MDELTMALGNPEYPGRCRGYVVVPWKYAFKGNLDSYKSHKRRKERKEEHWRQMMEQRLKEQEEKMRVEIERRMAVTISQIAKIGALPEVPLDLVINPSARKSSCASTEVAPGACIEDAPSACTEGPEELRAIKGVLVDDNQQYPVDFLCRCTPCELHKPFGDITMQVAYGSAFALFPGQTSHDMLIPPGYTSISVEEICRPQFKDLELDIPGGDRERKLKDADIPQFEPLDIDINPESPPKKQKKPMAAKQVPSKAQKTPQHHRKNHPTMKAHQKNRQTTKAYQKNHKTTAEETTS
jgi:hypothetical protein